MTKKEIKKSKFVKRLKGLMKQHNKNTYTVGEVLDMSNSTISRYLNFEMSPKIPTIKNISPTLWSKSCMVNGL